VRARKRIAANARLPMFPTLAKRAITLRRIDLRGMPFIGRKEPLINVTLQVSAVSPGVPLFVSHLSRDRKWAFVETGSACGWTLAKDIGFVDDALIKTWQEGPWITIVKDRVFAAGEGRVGDLYPRTGEGEGKWHTYMPKKGRRGMARLTHVTLSHDEARPFPFPLTYRHLAMVANEMTDQPYGWGGINGWRDCSALMKDLYAPFGIWLPRHSGDQVREGGVVVDLAALKEEEKKAAIISCGVPYLTLLGMTGHIMLYVGVMEGEPMIFHAVRRVPAAMKTGDEVRDMMPGRSLISPIFVHKKLLQAIRSMVYVAKIDLPETCRSCREVIK